MKKHFLKSFALLAMLFSALTMSAVSYCGETITATDGTTTAVLTCTQPTAGTYVMTISSTQTGFSGLKAPKNYVNLDGTSQYLSNANSSTKHTCTWNATSKTLTIEFKCTNAPVMESSLYLNFSAQEKEFDALQGQVFEWPTSCEAGSEEPEETGAIDWSSVEWVAGSDNKYKVYHECLSNVINVQQPGWAAEKGIYVTTPAGISECTVNGAIDGAGMILYLSSFTAKETEVTITHGLGTCTFWVYYADGTEGGEGGEEPEPTPEPEEPGEIGAIDWSSVEWVAGSDNKYKVYHECLSNVINVQQPGWAAEKGIYVTTPAGISECTVNGAIDGAGMILYLSSFTAKETEVTITHGLGTCTFWVYYADGTEGGSEGGEEPDPTPTPDPEETIITYTYFAPNWTVDPTSSATYDANTGAITVDLKSQFNSQWQAQVKVKHDVAFSADKQYTLSCKFHATAAVGGVTIKMDDDKPVVYADQSVNLPANEDYIYTSAPSNGIAGNSQILVFDFGWAPPCQITISDILIQEVESTTPPAIEHPSPAPVPTLPAEQVFSIYSNAYTPAVNRTMGYWNQTTQEQEVQLAEGDKAFYYTNCNYLGWELHSKYDMTAYPMLHMDVYVAEAGCSIGFTPIWGGEAEKAYALQAGWNPIDIDLTADFAAINLATIDQLKWANMPATCYIDNVYFFNDGTTEPVEPTPVESNYCQNTLTNGANSIDLTCEKVSVGNYRIIIEGSNLGQNGMDNATSGSFIIVNNEKTENITKGSLLKQYINTTLSTTSKVICEVPSTVDPKFDGNLYIMMPGEVNYGTISDVIWGTCPEAEEDTQAPTMTSATVESYTHNSAVIAVVAEDNVGVAKYQIVDAGNSVDQTLTATDGKIALSGLASATTYNLTIYAIDKAGNKSAGLAVAAFTTDALVYCDFPTGNNGDANYGNPNGRCFITISKLTGNNLRVTVEKKAESANLDFLYVVAGGATPSPATMGENGKTEGGEEVMSVDLNFATLTFPINIEIKWSVISEPGEFFVNCTGITESNLCQDLADKTAPEMIDASLANVNHNSAIINVSAIDNETIAQYRVTYNTTTIDITPDNNQIIVEGLAQSTGYTFTIYAIDAAGNVSSNFKTVSATTTALISEPSSLPTAPTWPANQVKAIYSDTYSADCNFGDWGSGTAYTSDTYGKKFVTTNLGYFGLIGFEHNCSQMENLHIDIWCANNTSLGIVPIYKTGQAAHEDKRVTKNIIGGQWNSIDIPLTEFVDVPDWSNIREIKIDNVPNQTLWFNNIYFYTTQAPQADNQAPTNVNVRVIVNNFTSAVIECKATDNSENLIFDILNAGNVILSKNAVSDVATKITINGLTINTLHNLNVVAKDESGNQAAPVSFTVQTQAYPISAPAPIHLPENAFSLYSNAYTPAIAFSIGGWGQATLYKEIDLATNDKAFLLENTDYLGLEINNNKPVDISEYTRLHVDIYALENCTLKLTPISVGPKETLQSVNLVANQWNSIDINLASFTDVEYDKLIQIKFADGGGRVYVIDNVYFHKPIEITEDIDPATLPNGAICDVQFGREMTVADGIWNTISLPFSMTADQISNTFGVGTRVAKLQSTSTVASQNAINLVFAYVNEIEAGTPYIILPQETGKDKTIANVTIDVQTHPIVIAGQVTMHPVLKTISYNYGNGDPIKFFLSADGDLHYNEASNSIKALRAYFTFDNVTSIAAAAQVRARVVFNENVETGMDNLINENAPLKVIENGQLIIIRDGVRYNIQGQKL